MEFWDTYTPSDHPSHEFDHSHESGEEGHYETFGPDFDYVMSVFKETPERVWTVIDPDEGEWDDEPIVVNGLRYCNRIFYIVTQEKGSEGETYKLY